MYVVDVHTVNVWGLTVGSVVGLKLGLGAVSARACRARYVVLHSPCIRAAILYD